MVMTGLQLLTNNTESYAKPFNLKVAEQKASQTQKNTSLTHSPHTQSYEVKCITTLQTQPCLRHFCLYAHTSMQTHAHVQCTLLSS